MQSTSHPHQSSPAPQEQDSARLAALLTLQDIEEIEALERNKHRAGVPLTDAELALTLFAKEARSSLVIENDRLIAQRLQEMENGQDMPMGTAGTSLQQPRSVGPTTPSHRLDGQHSLSQSSTSRSNALGRQDSFENSVKWVYDNVMGWLFKSGEGSGVPRYQAAASERLTGHECVICGDPIKGIEVRTPCDHYYDRTCVVELFEAACKDETLFPPRCCKQPIPLEDVQPFLTPAAWQLIQDKGREYTTLKRVYCSTPTCSRFLGSQTPQLFFNSFLTCPDCRAQTCGHCRKRVDPTRFHHTCLQEDEVDSELLALGAQQNWARCPGCSQLIELSFGCYHMTCRCKTEFCYLCKASWKTCMCAQWDEHRLYAAAEERVDAQLRNGAPQAGPAQPVQPQVVLPEVVPTRRSARQPLPQPPIIFPEIVPTRRAPTRSATLAQTNAAPQPPARTEVTRSTRRSNTSSSHHQAPQPPAYPLIFPEIIPTRRKTDRTTGTTVVSRTLRPEPTMLDISTTSSRTSTMETIRPDPPSTPRSASLVRRSSTSLSPGQQWLETRGSESQTDDDDDDDDDDAQEPLSSSVSSLSSTSSISTRSSSSLRVSSPTSTRTRRLTQPAPYPPTFISKLTPATSSTSTYFEPESPTPSQSSGKNKQPPSSFKPLRSFGSLSSLSSFLKNSFPSTSPSGSTSSISAPLPSSSTSSRSLAPSHNRRSTVSISTPVPSSSHKTRYGRSTPAGPSASNPPSPTQSPTIPSRTSKQPPRTSFSYSEDRPDSGPKVDEFMRQRLIYEMMNILRVNHDCDHIGKWNYRSGAGRCEHCQSWLRRYLFVCSECQTNACNRCRRNRL